MGQQYQKWVSLVEQKLEEKKWTKSDLTQIIGLRSQATLTDLLKNGKGSDALRLKISKVLAIREPWSLFKEE